MATLPSALAARLKVVEETAAAGERLKALAAYRAADVFLMTSRIESYPRVVNEALFFGMPVISTRCFGTVEQITEDDNGLFYEAGDDAALASRMSYLLSDSTRRAELARNARYSAHHKVMQYGQMIELYQRCYGQLLIGPGVRKEAA
jgi:glycosyltransferase involved in cell wall biosynthesis